MNDKFFNLPEERQRAILNAGYRVFGRNKYAKAPMSEIAEAAGISKALLFHYFRNKRELYLYLWDRAEELTARTKDAFRVYEAADYFGMLRRGLAAKCDIMRTYPYLGAFSLNAYYEEDPEVGPAIRQRVQAAADRSFDALLPAAGAADLRKDVSAESVFNEILCASDGLMNRWYRAKTIDVDAFEREYGAMIDHWETIYREGNN